MPFVMSQEVGAVLDLLPNQMKPGHLAGKWGYFANEGEGASTSDVIPGSQSWNNTESKM